MKLNPDTKELTDFIKAKTGAQMVIIIVGSTTVPCHEKQTSGKCVTPHQLNVCAEGIKDEYIPATFEQIMEMMEGNVPSPINS